MIDNHQPRQVEEFQDPLENYEPPTFDDPLERALYEQQVSAIQHQPYTSVTPETTIEDALKTLADLQHTCLLIEEEGKLVGLFTDRDALDKVALEYDEIKRRPIRTVMRHDPTCVYETDSSAAALCVMSVSGYRHVPVIDLENNLVGIVSPQRITDFLQEYTQSDV